MQMPDTARAPFAAQAPEGSRIYAIGDIHGRLDLLERLLARMAEDCARGRPERVAVVFLGDYVDRGPNSRLVIERLLHGAPQGGAMADAEWICLKGNHEEYLLRFVDDGHIGPAWCLNGGLETLRSYAGELPEGLGTDPDGLRWLLTRTLPPAHLRFLARLPVMHREG